MSYQKDKRHRISPSSTSQSQEVKIVAEGAKILFDQIVAGLLKHQLQLKAGA